MIIVACPCSQLRESSPQPYKPDEPPEIRNTPEPCLIRHIDHLLGDDESYVFARDGQLTVSLDDEQGRLHRAESERLAPVGARRLHDRRTALAVGGHPQAIDAV